MNIKSISLLVSITVAVVYFISPTLRDQQMELRFERQSIPAPRPDQALEASHLYPAVGSPVDEVSSTPSESIISPIEPAPRLHSSVLTEPDSPSAEASLPLDFDQFDLADAGSKIPALTDNSSSSSGTLSDVGSEDNSTIDNFSMDDPSLREESVVTDVDSPAVGPFDAPIPMLEDSIEEESTANPDRQQLARIYKGKVKPSVPGKQPAKVAWNQFADAGPRGLDRPIARPRFDFAPLSVDIGGSTPATSEPTEQVAEDTADTLVPPKSPNSSMEVSIQTEEPTPEPTPAPPSVDSEEATKPTAATPELPSRESILSTSQQTAPSEDKEELIESPQPVSSSPASEVEGTSLPLTPQSLSPKPSLSQPSEVEPSPAVLNQGNGTKEPPLSYQLQRHPSPLAIMNGGPFDDSITPSASPCERGHCADAVLSVAPECHQGCGLSIGGWLSAGYHSESNDLFNSRPGQVALHQGWLYAELAANEERPLGFRIDAMYGIDANDTQAFGNNPGEYDYLNGLDFGSYGWAIPQAYVEVALGEWSIRAGHFFTLLGYEVVTAPDNFFYSHAMTMYNSEPFTHTGALINRTIGDLDVFAGWTLGWDTGFDQLGGGSSWLGGFRYALDENASLAYFSTAGDFGWRGDEGYSQSVVLDLSLTDKLNYVVQSDYLRVKSTGEDNVGINQYAIYSLSNKVSLGARMEWWKGDVLTGYAPHNATLPAAGSLSYYAATVGLNVRPLDSLVIRPEVRFDWSPAADYDESYYGIDAVWSF